jgi:predicted MFS family arabinose efflux permease
VTGSIVPPSLFSQRSRGIKLGLVTTGTCTFSTGRFLLSPLLPTIIDSLAISAFAAGIGLTMMSGITALVRYPGGRLSDDLSRKTVIVGGLVVSMIGFGVLAGVGNYPTFLLGATAVGVGVGLYSTAALAWLSDLFVDQQGLAMGINNGSIYLAGILGAVLANAVITTTAWRSAFLPVIVALIILVPAFHFGNNEPYRFERPDLDIRSTFLRLIRSAHVRRMLLIGALFGVAWQGVITFLPTFLQNKKAVSPTLANNLFALLFTVGIGANLLSGRVSDRVSVPGLIAGVATTTVIGLCIVVFADGTPVLVGGIVVLGAGLAAIWPALQSYMMNYFPQKSKGGDYGAFSAIYGGIAGLGPSIVGFLVDTYSFTVAFLCLSVCLIFSAVLSLALAYGR